MSLHESLNSAAFPRKINWRVGGMTGHVDVIATAWKTAMMNCWISAGRKV